MTFSSFSKLPKYKQYIYGIGAVGITSFICFSFPLYINAQIVAFILLLVLSLLALVFDIFPVLLCALLTALIWGFFFMPPTLSFIVETTEDIVTLCMYFLISIVIATLTYKIRQVEKILQEKEKKAEAVKLYNTLLNSLSHEFRTPISAIIAATDNLLDESSNLNIETQKNTIGEISIAALRLNRQVENLLNMSRIESGFMELKKDWCDVGELLYNIISQFDDQKKNHTVQVHINHYLPLCKLDDVLMEQVFYNLINNALQYTPGGTIIDINVEYDNGYLNILIIDNGAGFPPAEIKKAFDKFYRINKFIPGGTGLGLSIAKGFIEAHSGTIELKNRISGGAEFIIRIPTEIINFDQQENEKKLHTYN